MNRQERRAAAKQSQIVAPQNLAVAKSLEAAKQGQALFNLGRYAEALECFNLFARLNPNVAPLYQTRGLCLQRLGRLEEAQADFERSIALNPNEAETHKNLGTLHSRFGRMEQAFASFDRALALRPNFSAALNEKARALWSVQSLDEAFAAFHQSLAIEPGNADTIWNLALLQMLTGDFERGLSGREARWKASSLGLIDRGFSQALWLRDKPLEGKTILLHADEALGDSIQFARYVPFVAALGARVILEVKPAVQRLLAAVPGVAHCVDRSSTPSLAFDLHCPLGSLPLAFGTRLDTIPFAQGFLPAPPAERVTAWERPAWSPHALARRPGLVGGSRPQQRSQPVDIAARACAAAGLRCPVRLPAKRHPGSGPGLPPRTRGHNRPDGTAHRFQRDGGAGVLSRSGDLGRHQCRAPHRRARRPGLDHAAVQPGLALAAPSRRQSVVFVHAAVQATGARRLGQRRGQRSARAGGPGVRMAAGHTAAPERGLAPHARRCARLKLPRRSALATQAHGRGSAAFPAGAAYSIRNISRPRRIAAGCCSISAGMRKPWTIWTQPRD